MQAEIKKIIARLESTDKGNPWFGRPVLELLEEFPSANAFTAPSANSHSAAALLWHMISWAEFVLHRLEGSARYDNSEMEALDWRPLDPEQHSWKKGIARYKKVQKAIVQLLQTKEDSFLPQTVQYRTYDFHWLLNGLAEHTIYHAGQIAYLQKLVS